MCAQGWMDGGVALNFTFPAADDASLPLSVGPQSRVVPFCTVRVGLPACLSGAFLWSCGVRENKWQQTSMVAWLLLPSLGYFPEGQFLETTG